MLKVLWIFCSDLYFEVALSDLLLGVFVLLSVVVDPIYIFIPSSRMTLNLDLLSLEAFRYSVERIIGDVVCFIVANLKYPLGVCLSKNVI
ncbi:MAG: hypothetical protein Q6363_001765 [Candidatus Njordarchaeota archaeon]